MVGKVLEKYNVFGFENIRKSMDSVMDCFLEVINIKEMCFILGFLDCNVIQNYFYFIVFKLILDF